MSKSEERRLLKELEMMLEVMAIFDADEEDMDEILELIALISGFMVDNDDDSWNDDSSSDDNASDNDTSDKDEDDEKEEKAGVVATDEERKHKATEATRAAAEWAENSSPLMAKALFSDLCQESNDDDIILSTQDEIVEESAEEIDVGQTNTVKRETESPTNTKRARVSGEAFRRVDDVEWGNQIISGLEDNSYEKQFGEDGYGFKASAVLTQVRGKDFRHEKTKRKRGNYKGGSISMESNSFKYD